MVLIEPAATGGAPYLNKKSIQEQGVKVVTIKTEPTPVEVDFEGKNLSS